MTKERRQNPGAHYLLMAASSVIVVGGLKLGQPVLLPFALALFLAVMSLPLMFWLRKKGAPAPLAILSTVLVTAGLFVVMILLASQSATEFGAQYPRYEENLTNLLATGCPPGLLRHRETNLAPAQFLFQPMQVYSLARAFDPFQRDEFSRHR